ncbi:MAG TPA: hypothetical protein VMV69_16600 [Pirellulales bacterium]|nr:hypothetical protein [Pirellulales bacterium]
MTDRSKQERDQRALDALFVSQLRRHERCDEVDVDHLPKLTKEEKEALESLGPDFIGRLLAGNVQPIRDDSPVENEELLCAGGMSYGMNRADIDEGTAEEIERKRNEIIEKHNKKVEQNE